MARPLHPAGDSTWISIHRGRVAKADGSATDGSDQDASP